MTALMYRCCEHCADDPRYHEDYPPDSHDTWCSLSGCIEGKRTADHHSTEPCSTCGWTGPQTQYLAGDRREVKHPDGPHESDWLPRSLSTQSTGVGAKCWPKYGFITGSPYCGQHGRETGWPCSTGEESD